MSNNDNKKNNKRSNHKKNNNMGRPRKEIDFEQFEKLCALLCTLSDIAGWFRVSEDTIETRVKEHYNATFSEVYKKHSAIGKVSLRRKQYEIAMDGNVTMLIWLGKQWLNQKDKQELSGDATTPIQVIFGGNATKDKWPKCDDSTRS